MSDTPEEIQRIAERLDEIPWDDAATASEKCREIVAWFRAPGRLRDALAGLSGSDLFGDCEHKRFQDKYVLCRGPRVGASVRAHVFLPGHADRPEYVHNHRWPFFTHVLRGHYVHTLYHIDRGVPRVLLRQSVGEGQSYFLSVDAYHTVAADPYTMTLLVRGPTVHRAATFFAADGARTFEHRGRQDESTDAADIRRMSVDYWRETVGELGRRGYLP